MVIYSREEKVVIIPEGDGTIVGGRRNPCEKAINEAFQSGWTEGYNSGITADCGEAIEESYQEGYSSGRTDGYEQGVEDSSSAYTIYYQSGYTDGRTSGYTEGYEKGQEDCPTCPSCDLEIKSVELTAVTQTIVKSENSRPVAPSGQTVYGGSIEELIAYIQTDNKYPILYYYEDENHTTEVNIGHFIIGIDHSRGYWFYDETNVFNSFYFNEMPINEWLNVCDGNLHFLNDGSNIWFYGDYQYGMTIRNNYGGTPLDINDMIFDTVNYDGLSAVTVSASAVCDTYYDYGFIDGHSSGMTDGTALIEYDVFFNIPYSSSPYYIHIQPKAEVKLNGETPQVERDYCETWYPILSADQLTFKSKSAVYYDEISAITSIDIYLFGTSASTFPETIESPTINGAHFNLTGQSFSYTDEGEERIFHYHLDGELTNPPAYYNGLLTSVYFKVSGCTGFTPEIVTRMIAYFDDSYLYSFDIKNHYGIQTNDVGEYGANITLSARGVYDWGQYKKLSRIHIYFPYGTLSQWDSGWSISEVKLNGFADKYENNYDGGYSIKIDHIGTYISQDNYDSVLIYF